MPSEIAEEENSEMLLISVAAYDCETECELRNLRLVDGATDIATRGVYGQGRPRSFVGINL